MEEFEIIQPSPWLAPYVKHYWFLKASTFSTLTQRIIPTGLMSLVFHREKGLYSMKDNSVQPRSFLSGQGTEYSDLVYSDTVHMISVVFQPMGAKVFFRMPMNEIRERNISIDILDDLPLYELEQCLTDTIDNRVCVHHIEKFLMKRIYQLQTHNVKRITSVVQSIQNGESDITSLAQTACLGYKQFKRVFTEYIGLNPKDYLRIIRFQRTLHIWQLCPQISLTQLAYEGNYYDQSHLIKEFKAFSGYTPGEYLAIGNPYSDYFS